MTMRRKEMTGTKYTPALDTAVDANQTDLVDTLTADAHGYLGELLGGCCSIVSRVPAYNHEAQPVQARGRIVWNRAYQFQSHGPSYLDPIPDPDGGW
jgi:hypothetical protein